MTTPSKTDDDDDFVTFVHTVVKHPLVIVRFALDHDLSMVFHAIEHCTSGALTGVGLTPVRRSKGAHFVRLNPDLLTRLFAPVVTPVGVSGNEWLMQMQPLSAEIRVQKRPSGKYVCFYPFKQQGRNGQLHEIWVDGTPRPKLQLWFDIHATFQAAKDTPKQRLECRIECPDVFTQHLFRFTDDAAHKTI